MIAYVFGYASLVALRDPVAVEGTELPPLGGRLRGFRRSWGVAMDNWDAVNDHKHFVDPESRERPALRVAYLDVDPQEGATVNGLALPVDEARLAELDAREVNYDRIEVSDGFEPADAAAGRSNDAATFDATAPVYTYRGSAAARERRRRGAEEGNACISAEYAALVCDSFAALGPDALAEYERTTDPSPFPTLALKRVWRVD